MKKKFYLTTPLYYVNSKPHIGHSYTNIAADALARFHRQRFGRENVYFLTGTDEHGQKIDRAAKAAGLPPQEFTDKISSTFVDLWKTLNISYDDFIRTTEKRHKDTVAYVWERMKASDALYKHTYDGYYCVSCETFIAEGVLDAATSTCPDCKKPLERMKEDTYFFKMSVYQDRLIKDIQAGKLKILPESRKNEVLGFLLNNKLTDLSVSRPKNRLAWGIPLPFDPEHVTYVWFDALVNYISACGYGRDEERFKKWWPAQVHIIGKDIIRHHAVLWPTFLYALGVELPEMIFAHGWWVQDGQKMSKSLGNVTDPVEIVKVYGVDPYRYFLLNETPFGQDGTFSEDALIMRFNTDLANDLGNLVQRSLTMCEKYFNCAVPAYSSGQDSPIRKEGEALIAQGRSLFSALNPKMEVLAFSEALREIWGVISRANRFIESSAPWTLAKEKKDEELKFVILTLIETLKLVALAAWPFIPKTAEAIWERLAIASPIDKADPALIEKFTPYSNIVKGTPLFPRIEVKK